MRAANTSVAVGVAAIAVVCAEDFARVPVWLIGFLLWTAAVCWGRSRDRIVGVMEVTAAFATFGAGVIGDLRILMIAGGVTAATAALRLRPRLLAAAATAVWLPQATAVAAIFGLPDLAFRGTAAAIGLLAATFLSRPSLGRRSEFPQWLRLTPAAVAVLAGVGGLCFVLSADADQRRLLTELPRGGLLVRSTDVPLTPAEATYFERVETLKRRYRVPGGTFDLLAVDGRGNRHAVHDPTYCHLGDGWQEINRQILPLPRGRAVRVRYGRAAERTEAVFWFSNGHRQTASAMRYWWWATLRRLSLGRSGAEPVLLVLQPATSCPPDWASVLDQFPALARL